MIGELIDVFGLLGLLFSALDIGETKDRSLDPRLIHGNEFKQPFNLFAHRQKSPAKQSRLFNVISKTELDVTSTVDLPLDMLYRPEVIDPVAFQSGGTGSTIL